MKKMKWMYMLLTICFLTSCAAYKTESRMQDIQLGMSKRKVVSILGKNYEPMGARITPDGTIETIRYFSTSVLNNNEDYYLLNFKDDKLVEWFKDPDSNRPHKHPRQEPPRH